MKDKSDRKLIARKEKYVGFLKKFKTERKCQDYLFQQRWPNGFKCPVPNCGHNKFYFHENRNLYQCKACKKQTSITAGTIFHKSHTKLTTWFRMIYFVTNRKYSTRKLQEKLRIKSYKTAWVMRKKIEEILKEFHFEKLMGVVDVEDILKWKIKKLDAIKKRGNRLGKKELSSRANSLP